MLTVKCKKVSVQPFCTYTIGYWGNTNDDPRKEPDVVSMLAKLPGKVLKVGPWTLDADCIDVLLPGPPLSNQGNNLQLACNDINSTPITQNDVNNMLLQTIGAMLNVLNSPALGTTRLGDLDCSVRIPDGLTLESTVNDLIKLANSKLPGFNSRINDALTSINECYDRCSLFGLAQEDQDNTGLHTDSKPGTLRLQPNPAGSFLRVRLTTAEEGQAQIRLLTVQGQVVQTLERDVLPGENLIELDLGTLRAGTYMLQVRDKDRIMVERFVKAGL